MEQRTADHTKSIKELKVAAVLNGKWSEENLYFILYTVCNTSSYLFKNLPIGSTGKYFLYKMHPVMNQGRMK